MLRPLLQENNGDREPGGRREGGGRESERTRQTSGTVTPRHRRTAGTQHCEDAQIAGASILETYRALKPGMYLQAPPFSAPAQSAQIQIFLAVRPVQLKMGVAIEEGIEDSTDNPSDDGSFQKNQSRAIRKRNGSGVNFIKRACFDNWSERTCVRSGISSMVQSAGCGV